MLCSHCNIAHCFTKPTNITLIIWNRASGKEAVVVCSDSPARVKSLIAYNKSRGFSIALLHIFMCWKKKKKGHTLHRN